MCAHLQRRDESKGGKQKQAVWLADQNSHQKLAASLAADESDEFSTDTEQRAYHAILMTIYGPVGHKGGQPVVMDVAVSPGFMKEHAAEKPARPLSSAEQGKVMRDPEELAAAKAYMRPLGGYPFVSQTSDEMEASWKRARDNCRGILRQSPPTVSKLAEMARMQLARPPIPGESPAGSAEKPVAAASTPSMPAVPPSPIEPAVLSVPTMLARTLSAPTPEVEEMDTSEARKEQIMQATEQEGSRHGADHN